MENNFYDICIKIKVKFRTVQNYIIISPFFFFVFSFIAFLFLFFFLSVFSLPFPFKLTLLDFYGLFIPLWYLSLLFLSFSDWIILLLQRILFPCSFPFLSYFIRLNSSCFWSFLYPLSFTSSCFLLVN